MKKWKLQIKKIGNEWRMQLVYEPLGIVPAEWWVHQWKDVEEYGPRLWKLREGIRK